MNSIRSVFTALSNLAASINALASVLDVATGRLRQQLALDSEPAVLPHNGEAPGLNDPAVRKHPMNHVGGGLTTRTALAGGAGRLRLHAVAGITSSC